MMAGSAIRARIDRASAEVGEDVAKKGRARRFREARALKQGYDDGLFREGGGTLADLDDDAPRADTDDDLDDDLDDDTPSWDPDLNPDD
jgi:hypothetical protein